MESFRHLILHTVIVPGALALASAPPVALKKFIAVSHLDAPAVVEYDPPVPPTKTRQVVNMVLVLGFEGLIFYTVFKGSQTLSALIFFVLIGGWYLVTVFQTMGDFIGGCRSAVYRTAKGANEWRDLPVSTCSKLSYGLRVAGALTLAAAAYITPSTLTSWALSFAVAHRYMSTASAFRLSIRGILLLTCGYIVTSAVVCLITFPLIDWYLRKWPPAPSEGTPEVTTGISLEMLAFIQPFGNVAFFITTGILATACYRFDYFLHVAKTAGTETAFVPESIDAPEPTDPSLPRRYPLNVQFSVQFGPAPAAPGEVLVLSRGVIVPSRAPKNFSKVYYSTVVSTWLAAQLGLAAALAFVPFLNNPSMPDVHSIRFMICSLPLNIILTSVAILIVAKSRGELVQLWTYVEAWRPVMKKREAVTVEDGGEVEEVDSIGKDDAEVSRMLLAPARDVKA